MNSKERIDAAIALDQPDRVPAGPILDHYAAAYSGITNADLMGNAEKRIGAVLKTMNELGPWDITFAADFARAGFLKIGIPARIRFPGKEIPENEVHQVFEEEFFTPEDYDRLLKLKEDFPADVICRLYPELQPWDVPQLIKDAVDEFARDKKVIEATGTQLAVGGYATMPFEFFSYARSLSAFCYDLFDRPEKVKKASRAFVKGSLENAIAMATTVGVPRIFLGLGRAGPTLVSPSQWEEFIWPHLETIVREVAANKMITLLHCDTDWTRALPWLKRLPPRTCILDLDSSTDIFKAKEILGDSMCIMGDVPATLTAFGKKDDVMAYCKRLIQEVGKGGGFILSSGCSIPLNAKAENVKALREAVEEWGWY